MNISAVFKRLLAQLAFFFLVTSNAFVLAVPDPGVTIVSNPNLQPGCGIKVALVLDASASIDAGEQAQVRTAAQGFIDALKGSGSSIAIVEFADKAFTPIPYTLDTSANASTFTNYLGTGGPSPQYHDNSFVSISTNWDAALIEVQKLSPRPDLVVFMTDGDPNFVCYTTSGGDPTITGPCNFVANAPVSNPIPGNDNANTQKLYQSAADISAGAANLVKAAGSHILAVGVGLPDEPKLNGESRSLIRLKELVDGDNSEPYNGSNFSSADYIMTSDFGTLLGDLTAVASALCGASVTITKYLNGDVATTPWEFTGQVSGTFKAPTNGVGSTSSGKIFFQWTPTGCTGGVCTDPTTIKLTETPQAGFVLDHVTCSIGSGAEVNQTVTGSSFTLDLAADKFANCKVFNTTFTQQTPSVATSIHNAQHAVITSASINATVHDSVTVTGGTLGTPTGSVTISFFTNGTCTDPAQITSTALPLVGGSVDATTFAQTLSIVGSISFQAHYSGDTNYNSADGLCEPLTVNQAATSINTQLKLASDNTNLPATIPVGTALYDTSVLSGATADATGTITYTVYTDTDCKVLDNTHSASTVAIGAQSDTYTFDTAGTFYFQASYSGDTNNAPATSTCASETFNVVALPSLSITKVALQPSVLAGSFIVYQLTIANDGDGDATGVTVTDVLPNGNAGSPVSWIISGGSNVQDWSLLSDNGVQTLSLASITIPAHSEIFVEVAAGTNETNCATYSNTATLTSDAGTITTDPALIEVHCPAPNLSITKVADDPNPVQAGADIGYTVTLTNSGDGDAHGVTVTDVLPNGNAATPVTWSIDQTTGAGDWVYTSTAGIQKLELQTTTIPAGGSLSAHITASTNTDNCATYSNTASFASGNAGSGEATASIEVQCPGVPDLKITKTADDVSVTAGATIGYTLTIENTGTTSATNVNLSEALPGGNVGFAVNWTIDTSVGDPDAFVLTGTTGNQELALVGQPTTIKAGTTLTVHIIATTNSDNCAAYSNTATLTSDAGTTSASADTIDVACVPCPVPATSLSFAATTNAVDDNCVVAPVTTTAVARAGLGQAISDTAHLHIGVTPIGTITFYAYGPDDTICSNAPVFTSDAIPVTGNGDYHSGNFVPHQVGTYLWIARFTDASNQTVSTECGDLNETSVVTKPPSGGCFCTPGTGPSSTPTTNPPPPVAPSTPPAVQTPQNPASTTGSNAPASSSSAVDDVSAIDSGCNAYPGGGSASLGNWVAFGLLAMMSLIWRDRRRSKNERV